MESVNVVAREAATSVDKKIPAVIYGKSMGSRSIFVLAGQQKARGWHAGSKFTMELDGTTFRGTLEEVQKNPIGTEVKHLSFHVVSNTEVTKVDVPLVTKSTRDVPKGGVMTVMMHNVLLKGKLTDLPEELVVDVSDMKLNDTVTLADITLPKGVEWGYSNETHLADKVAVVCKTANASQGDSDATDAEEAEETTTTLEQ